MRRALCLCLSISLTWLQIGYAFLLPPSSPLSGVKGPIRGLNGLNLQHQTLNFQIPPRVVRRGAALFASTQEEEASVRKMKAKDIKQELTTRGVNSAGIVDKEDLVRLLLDARATGPLPEVTVKTQGTDYTVAKAKFRRSTPPPTVPGQGASGGNMPGPKCYVVVDMMLQGRSFEFLIDSGATPTIVSESLRRTLNLEPLAGGQQIHGVSAGGVNTAPRVMLMGATLGGPTGYVVNMDALVMDTTGVLPSGVSGLLGIKYLQYFGIVDFDFTTNTLHLYAYDAKTETGSTAIEDLLSPAIDAPLLKSRGLPMRQDPASAIFFVDLHMGVSPAPAPLSPPIPVIVDLGAGLTMVNWRAAQLAGVSPSSPFVIKNAMKVWGIDGTTLPVDLCDFRQLRAGPSTPLIGGSYSNNANVGLSGGSGRIGIADLPAFGLIGYKDRPVGVLGMDLLGANRLVFDFRKNMLYTL